MRLSARFQRDFRQDKAGAAEVFPFASVKSIKTWGIIAAAWYAGFVAAAAEYRLRSFKPVKM